MPRFAMLLAACTLSAFTAVAVAQAEPLVVGSDDSIPKLLAAQTGSVVTLKFGCNDELTGRVKSISSEVVHLSDLTGKEFYDAVVELDSVHAVVVRAR